MADTKAARLPIGYWLRKADEVLTARINEAQAANGLTRTEWQVLNLLYEEPPIPRSQVNERLQPFAEDGAVDCALDSLVARGLVHEREDSGHRLTDAGQQRHAAALRLQKEIRQQAMRGVSEEDYDTTLRVLQALVVNLTESFAQRALPADAEVCRASSIGSGPSAPLERQDVGRQEE